MLNAKQRASLRAAANRLETVYYIGKDGVSEAVIRGVEEALLARELIKVKVQEACELSAREACGELCEALSADPVQVIGRRLVIYRRNKKVDAYKDFI